MNFYMPAFKCNRMSLCDALNYGERYGTQTVVERENTMFKKRWYVVTTVFSRCL